MQIVSLNILVSDEDAAELANHLAREARLVTVCGVADYCNRSRIKIEGFGTLIKPAGGGEILDPTIDQGQLP